jgi:ubiquinone/menaquinone biosynthesis C-methylase UbiE
VNVERALEPSYLRDQYDTTDKLDIRIAAHQLYSEGPDDFLDWILERLTPSRGDLLLDARCGRGSYHPALVERYGVRGILGVDLSAAMVAVTQAQSNARGLPVVAIEGTAERLPVPDAVYDVAMANHVLFLVDDVRAALRELRRALKPTGRAVLSTGAADHCARLTGLHAQAAARAGLQTTRRPGVRFNLDHTSIVAEVFPNVERHVHPDAFAFPSTDTAVRYYASGMIDAIANRPADNSHRDKLLPLVAEQIDKIVAREGVFRDPKDAGCFVVSAS